MDRSMIDAASGGALMDKKPAVARHLISNMAINTQQYGIRGPSHSWMVNGIGVASNQRLENQLTELTSLVRQLAVGQHQPAMAAKVCGICTSVEHPTDMCPTLQETESDQTENVGAIGGFQTESGTKCNSTIRIHTECISETSTVSTADSAISSTTFPTTTAVVESACPRQLPISRRLDEAACNKQPGSAGSSNLPSQTIPNPSGNASVITLRSGKELPQPTLQQLPRPAKADFEPNADPQSRLERTVPLPFPSRTISARKPKP
ncbi:hypothetical protein CR513_29813, partial [Mucuna pruriens]